MACSRKVALAGRDTRSESGNPLHGKRQLPLWGPLAWGPLCYLQCDQLPIRAHTTAQICQNSFDIDICTCSTTFGVRKYLLQDQQCPYHILSTTEKESFNNNKKSDLFISYDKNIVRWNIWMVHNDVTWKIQKRSAMWSSVRFPAFQRGRLVNADGSKNLHCIMPDSKSDWNARKALDLFSQKLSWIGFFAYKVISNWCLE